MKAVAQRHEDSAVLGVLLGDEKAQDVAVEALGGFLVAHPQQHMADAGQLDHPVSPVPAQRWSCYRPGMMRITCRMSYETYRVEITRDETRADGDVGIEITAYIDRVPETGDYSRGMLTRAATRYGTPGCNSRAISRRCRRRSRRSTGDLSRGDRAYAATNGPTIR